MDKSKIFFVNDLDSEITLSDGITKFIVPGEEIHKRLSFLENDFRNRREASVKEEIDEIKKQIREVKYSILNNPKLDQRKFNEAFNEMFHYVENYTNTKLKNNEEWFRKIFNDFKQLNENNLEKSKIIAINDFCMAAKENYPNQTTQIKKDLSIFLNKCSDFRKKFIFFDEYLKLEYLKLELCKLYIQDGKRKPEVENYVLANIGFVVEFSHKESKENKTKFITFPVKAIELTRNQANIEEKKYHDIHNILENISNAPSEYRITKEQLDIQINNNYHGTKTNSDNCNYPIKYYHSERSLYVHLGKNIIIKQIVERLRNIVSEKLKKMPEYELKAINNNIFLDIHSTRYVCTNCAVNTHNFTEKNSEFSVKIFNELQNRFGQDKLKDSLEVSARITADRPFNSKKKDISAHSEKGNRKVATKDSNVFFMGYNYNYLNDFFKYLKHGLHNYSIFSSGGSDQDKKQGNYTTYNQIVKPYEDKATNIIADKIKPKLTQDISSVTSIQAIIRKNINQEKPDFADELTAKIGSLIISR